MWKIIANFSGPRQYSRPRLYYDGAAFVLNSDDAVWYNKVEDAQAVLATLDGRQVELLAGSFASYYQFMVWPPQ